MAVDLVLAALFAGLTAYAVLGGADFGAGFWDLTAGGAERGSGVRAMVKRSMGPVWEANHVWLIFVLVVFWTGFPEAFAAVTQTLYVPLFLAAVGIIFRGTAFAVRGQAATIAEARVMGATFALSSVLVPFCFGAVIGAIASGQVPLEPAAGTEISSWTGPTSILVGALAVATGAFLAAVFLAADSVRANLPEMARAFRARALGAGVAAGAVALAGLAVVHSDAPALYDGLTSGAGLAMVVLSAFAGLLTLGLVWAGRFGLARMSAAAAVGAVVLGWAFAQRPDLLPGTLTVDAAAAPSDTLGPLLIAILFAIVVLAPALGLLFRLTLAGRLDPELPPSSAGEPDADAAGKPETSEGPRGSSGERLPAIALGVLASGALVLFLATPTIVRVGAALVLLAGIALGVFAIASPEFLAEDRDDG